MQQPSAHPTSLWRWHCYKAGLCCELLSRSATMATANVAVQSRGTTVRFAASTSSFSQHVRGTALALQPPCVVGRRQKRPSSSVSVECSMKPGIPAPQGRSLARRSLLAAVLLSSQALVLGAASARGVEEEEQTGTFHCLAACSSAALVPYTKLATLLPCRTEK